MASRFIGSPFAYFIYYIFLVNSGRLRGFNFVESRRSWRRSIIYIYSRSLIRMALICNVVRFRI